MAQSVSGELLKKRVVCLSYKSKLQDAKFSVSCCLYFFCVCVCGCGTEQVPRVGGDVLEVSIDTLKNDPIINQQKLGNHG